MKNILHIISSPMGDDSHSIRLGRAILKQLLLQYPGSVVTERTLVSDQPPYLDGRQIAALFKDNHDRSEDEKEKLHYSDAVLSDIKHADIIILGAPMYNFGIHALLKAFIDQVVRFGHTIAYQADGSRIGLLTDKTVYLAVTAGGSYRRHAFNPVENYIVGYLTTILNYIGISNITPFIIEGTATPGFTVDYDEVCSSMQELVQNHSLISH